MLRLLLLLLVLLLKNHSAAGVLYLEARLGTRPTGSEAHGLDRSSIADNDRVDEAAEAVVAVFLLHCVTLLLAKPRDSMEAIANEDLSN